MGFAAGATPSAPALATTSDGTLYLAVQGLDRIYLKILPNGGSWSAWQKLPGSTVGAPALAVEGPIVQLAARGSDGASIWHGRMDRGSLEWLGWQRLSGLTPSKPSLAAASDTEVYLAVRGTNSRIHVNRWAGGAWTGWSQMPTGSTPSGPSILVVNGQLHVAVRGADSSIYWCRRTLPSGAWSG